MSGGLDWQFVIVTLAALWGAWALLRPLLRFRAARRAASPTCARCAAGDACGSAKEDSGEGLVTLGAGRSARTGSANPPG